MLIVCGGCDATWSGSSRCHCSGCHLTFSGLTAFDAHRKRSRCNEPEKVGLREVDGLIKWADEDPRFAKEAA